MSRSAAVVMRRAFGWGAAIAAVRMLCSFISIKVTAVYLGPAGLALIAQFSGFVSLFQSVLGEGLVTGITRLSAEHPTDPARQRAIYATALRMGAAMALGVGLVLAVAAPWVAQWLLKDEKYTWLIRLSGIAIAAAMLADVLQSALAAGKEIHLIAYAVITSTVVGLVIFASLSVGWGIAGGLTGVFLVLVMSAAVSALFIHARSGVLKLAFFLGRFQWSECRRILSFYPMLVVNGALPPLALILVRDTLTQAHGLETTGLWQATWRLSEAYQAVLLSSISLYFMPSMGERVHQPVALQRHVIRSLLTAMAVTASLAGVLFLMRDFVVQIVFSEAFSAVSGFLALQLIGDVLKIGGWILAMVLVALIRTGWFIFLTAVAAAVFVGAAKLLVPGMGVEGALWAYLLTGLTQLGFGLFALRDVFFLRREPAKPLAKEGLS